LYLVFIMLYTIVNILIIILNGSGLYYNYYSIRNNKFSERVFFFFRIFVESYDVYNNNMAYYIMSCIIVKLLHTSYHNVHIVFTYFRFVIDTCVLKGKRWTRKMLLNTRLVYTFVGTAHSRCIKFRIVIRVLPFKSVGWQF